MGKSTAKSRFRLNSVEFQRQQYGYPSLQEVVGQPPTLSAPNDVLAYHFVPKNLVSTTLAAVSSIVPVYKVN